MEGFWTGVPKLFPLESYYHLLDLFLNSFWWCLRYFSEFPAYGIGLYTIPHSSETNRV